MSRLIGRDGQPLETVISGLEIGRYSNGRFVFAILGPVSGLGFVAGWEQDDQEIDINKACSAFRRYLEAVKGD